MVEGVTTMNLLDSEEFLSDDRLSQIVGRLHSLDKKYIYKQWNEITCDYLSFLKKLYNHFTGKYITDIQSINDPIYISRNNIAALMLPSLPNIICLLTNKDIKCQFINDINLIMKQNCISYLSLYYPYDGCVLFNVSYRCYWYIIDSLLRYGISIKPTIQPKPKQKPIQPKLKTFKVKYYPTPFHHNIFRIIYYKYTEYLKNAVWQEFRIKNPISVHSGTLQYISNNLRDEYEDYIRVCRDADDIVDFFKRVKLFNQLIEYRYAKTSCGLYNQLHFWIRDKYVNEEVYIILEKHDNDTLQWFLKYTDTFKNFDDLAILLYSKRYKSRKRKRLKTFGYPDIDFNGQWHNSYPVIQTGDESIDRQLRDLFTISIAEDYDQ